MSDVPATLYAETVEGAYLAYPVLGDGPVDLMFTPHSMMPIDLMWEEPTISACLRRLASFSRLIVFDVRGRGSSSRVHPSAVPALQTWMDDLGVVMDAVGSDRAAFLSVAELALHTMLFAATYPERVSPLALVNAYARYLRNDDCRWARAERLSVTPESLVAVSRVIYENDLTHVLWSIQAPTLLISLRGGRHVRYQHGRYLASRIPNARLVELSGEDHLFYAGRSEEVLDEVEEFLTGVRPIPVLDRVLATVMFTDIVGSTDHAAQLGDRRWRECLDRYDDLVQHHVARFRGRQVKSTGDGTLATFDGPARAVECARSISQAVRGLGFEIRAGLYTGEVEARGEDVAGVAVHIAARVSALAGASEVLVSRTVTDLVAGSSIHFEDRGEYELKGVPQPWRLFSVTA